MEVQMKTMLNEYEAVLSSYSKLDELITMLDKPSRNLGLIIAVSKEPSKEKDAFVESLSKSKKNKYGVIGFYKDIAVVTVETTGLWIYIVPREAATYEMVYDTKRKNG
jgi:hypothetical protein